MPATQDQLTLARSWIGASETDEVFNERYDRLGPDATSEGHNLDLAIEESLRSQLAAMVLDQPSRFSIEGALSADYAENMRALQALYDKFVAMGGISGELLIVSVLSVGRIRRPSIR